jgi:hypothetical protein
MQVHAGPNPDLEHWYISTFSLNMRGGGTHDQSYSFHSNVHKHTKLISIRVQYNCIFFKPFKLFTMSRHYTCR